MDPGASPPQTGSGTAASTTAAASTTSSLTLRSLLEHKASEAFAPHGVADIPIDTYEIDFRLAAMQRALVAHDAINRLLSQVEVVDLPDKLLDSIVRAEALGLFDPREVRWLKHINMEANKAKHSRALPF